MSEGRGTRGRDERDERAALPRLSARTAVQCPTAPTQLMPSRASPGRHQPGGPPTHRVPALARCPTPGLAPRLIAASAGLGACRPHVPRAAAVHAAAHRGHPPRPVSAAPPPTPQLPRATHDRCSRGYWSAPRSPPSSTRLASQACCVLLSPGRTTSNGSRTCSPTRRLRLWCARATWYSCCS